MRNLLLIAFLLPSLSIVSDSMQPHSEAIRLMLHVDNQRVAFNQKLVLRVALLNSGERDFYVYGNLLWGPSGGFTTHLLNQSGKEIESPQMDDTILPPPSSNDLTMFVRIRPDQFFGTERTIPLRELVHKPGNYSLRIEYRSPISQRLMDEKLQSLPTLWHGNPSLFSNTVELTVIP